MPGIVKNPIIELIIAAGFYLVQFYKCMHAGAGMEINRVKRAKIAGKLDPPTAGGYGTTVRSNIFSGDIFQTPWA